MRDTILTAALTFTLLAGGTAAIGTELLTPKKAAAPVLTLPMVTVIGHKAAPATPVVTLPMVVVTGKRAAPAEIVALPTVTVIGKRPATQVAVETAGSAAEPEVARGGGRPATSAGTRAGSFD